jgi:hypothetical protein
MIYLLCLIGALNIVLLIEVVSLHTKEQEKRGLVISYGKTFLFYFIVVIVVGFFLYILIQYSGLI